MKKVEIVNEKMTLGQLKKGLVVSGRLVLKETKRVTESAQRIKLYESIPKHFGLARITFILDRETREAKTALFDKELIENI